MNLKDDYEAQFSSFHDLMMHRVREVLIVSSLYDNFVLEEDGRLSERIFSEYVGLGLTSIPRIKRVSTAEQAFQALNKKRFDLVITMPRIVDMDPFEFGKKVKEIKPGMYVLLLCYNTIELERLVKRKNKKGIDRIFYWSGDTNLLLAIIKFIEDQLNIIRDTRAGVRVILVVEDNPLYYSSFLPDIYIELMTQTRFLISESLNDVHRMLRMRARPKILLSSSFEEAIKNYENYKENVLGIISDVEFPRRGKVDREAGPALIRIIKSENPELPVLFHSTENVNRQRAEENQVAFLDKNSISFHQDLRNFIVSNFGFGDFIFRYPDGREVDRAKNLSELEQKLRTIPNESFEYHTQSDHISTWLMARTEFELARELKPKKVSDFKNIDEARNSVCSAIARLLERNKQGIIIDFQRTRFDPARSFVKLGTGSLGGKGRGLAFIDMLLANTRDFKDLREIEIKTPPSTVICTEIFEEFLDKNNLKEIAIKISNDDEIVERFLASPLPDSLQADLRAFLDKVFHPVAVRSSSLLEDSHALPFAGIYNTYLLPNNHWDINIRHRQLCDAVRLVYASTYFQSPKVYSRSTNYRIEEQKMAVIIQKLAGETYGDYFYPVISGVAQSHNFYPFSHMKAEDGIAHIALGLGKTVVDGGKVYSFSPSHPKINPIYSSPREFLKKSQSEFYSLNLANSDIHLKKDDNTTLSLLPLSRAEEDGTLFFAGSTYSGENNAIRDTLMINGPRVVTFANVLKYEIFPLSDILKRLLILGQNAFATQIEIEFAVNLYRDKNKKSEFHFLQIRPLIACNEHFDVITLEETAQEDLLCFSNLCLGNGIFQDITDFVYVDPDKFDKSRTRAIAEEVGKINENFAKEGKNYVLLGFGRWGTSDRWLGIPVEWSQISQAKVIIESNLENFKVDPSQGSHFFHNITSLRLGYLHIPKMNKQTFVDWQWIKKQKPYYETEYVKHIRFSRSVEIKIDGRSSKGIITKPVKK